MPDLGAEPKRRDDRRISFGNDRRRILEVFDERILRRRARNRAEARKRELLAHVLAALDRVVDELEADGAGHSGGKPEAKSEDQVEEQVRLERQPRHVGAVDDRHRRDADAAGNADLLVALEQRVIERAVGVHLALQDRVLDAAPAQVQDVAL